MPGSNHESRPLTRRKCDDLSSPLRAERMARVPPVDAVERSRMLMPLLVRLTDSQVEMTDGVVSQVTNCVHHAMRVLEQVGSGRLTIDHEALLPDLHIN